MLCADCGKSFGGTFAYRRHIDRRADRCRTVPELTRRGLVRDDAGMWHQRRPTGQTVLPGLHKRRGSRPVEVRHVPSATGHPKRAQSGIPQQSTALSEDRSGSHRRAS